MRAVLTLAALLAALVTGCETTSGSGSGEGVNIGEKGRLFLKVFVDETARAHGPVDVKVALNGEEVINRTFLMGKESYDGQYQFILPPGEYMLSAFSQKAQTKATRKFYVRNDYFIQLYVTEGGKWRLTPASRRSILRFAWRKARGKPTGAFNPALWMLVPATGRPTALPSPGGRMAPGPLGPMRSGGASGRAR
jgi:hypothetical protein